LKNMDMKLGPYNFRDKAAMFDKVVSFENTVLLKLLSAKRN